MQIPLNVAYYYVGIPVMGGLGIDVYRRYRLRADTTLRYLYLSCGFFAASLACQGLPALFTHDSFSISFWSFFGDITQALGSLYMWLLIFRAYLATMPRVGRLARIFVYMLTIAITIEAIPRQFTPPYGVNLINVANGVALIYHDTLLYKMMSGVDSICLLLVSILFWQQATKAPQNTQKWRVRSLAVASFLGAIAFVVGPAFPLEKQLLVSTIAMTLGFISVVIAALIKPILRIFGLHDEPVVNQLQ